MRIKYAVPNKPRQTNTVVLPLKAVANAIYALQQRRFTILSVK